MNEQPKKRWGVLEWGIVVVVLLLGVLWLSSQFTYAAKTAPQMKAVSDAKQMIIAVKQYAGQNCSDYPHGFEVGATPEHTSNRMFRELFVEGIVTDERIFGCLNTPFVPDGKIGEGPLYSQAMEPGENHWMMLRDQTDTSLGNAPLITENSLTTTWPPRWDLSANGAPRPARAWKGAQIVLGCNDGSVQVCKLLPDGTLDVCHPGARGLKAWAEWMAQEDRPLPEFAPVEQAPQGRR